MNYLPFIVSRVMDAGTDPATEGGRNIDDRNFVALSLLAQTYRGIIRTLLITPSPDILRLRLESLHDLQGVATKKETPTINVPSRSAGDSIKNK
jgi:hypothetical protein